MTRTWQIPTGHPQLGAAERAARFDDLTAMIELVPAGPNWPHTPQRYISVEWIKAKRRFFYEWAMDGNDPNPGPAYPCPFNSMVLTREEVVEMIAGFEPARMTKVCDQYRQWWLDLQASEDAWRRLTPEQQQLQRAIAESLNHEGKARSNANREADTKAKTRRHRNAVIEQQSEAAAQRAALLP